LVAGGAFPPKKETWSNGSAVHGPGTTKEDKPAKVRRPRWIWAGGSPKSKTVPMSVDAKRDVPAWQTQEKSVGHFKVEANLTGKKGHLQGRGTIRKRLGKRVKVGASSKKKKKNWAKRNHESAQLETKRS